MMKKNLFICSTPYQLIAVYKIKELYLKNQHVDLLLTDAVDNLEQWLITENLIQNFDNIYKVGLYGYAKENIHDFDVSKNFNILNEYVQTQFAFLDDNYTDIFFANLHSWIVIWAKNYEIKSISPIVEFHYFDDGIYSYIGFDKDYVKKRIKLKDAYLYEKDLICVDYDIPIHSISLQSTLLMQKLENLFVNSEIRVDMYDQILLEHHFSEKKYYTLQDEIFQRMSDINFLNTVLKPHHRRRRRTESDIRIMESMMPFELMLQKSNKSLILVTVFSTAVLLAPYISRTKLKLILLYKIFKDYFSSEEYKRMDMFVDKLQKNNQIHQFIIPDTYCDLKNAIYDNQKEGVFYGNSL